MFVNIPDTINSVNQLYHLSTDASALLKGAEDLENILVNMQPNPKNREDAQALLYRIKSKALALNYFDGGYLQEDFVALTDYLKEVAPKAEQAGYVKTHTLVKNLLAVAEFIRSVMDGAESAIYRVRDDDGNPATADVSVLSDFKRDFDSRIDRLAALTDTATLFGERVKMRDIKASALADLKSLTDWAEKAIKQIRGSVNDEFFKTYTKSLDDEEGLKFFDYQPSLPDRASTAANAIVVMTPLHDEFLLFCRAYARERALSFVSVHVSAFLGKDGGFLSDFFNAVKERGLNLIIYGLSAYHDENKSEFFIRLLYFTKSGGVAVVEDERGDRKVYDDIYSIAQAQENLSDMDVSYKYLTMPNYNAAIREMEDKGMISGSEYEFVRKNMPFMGFVGLNNAVSLFVQGRNWRESTIDLSETHYHAATEYIKNIPTQAQFIDVGWINLELERAVQKERGEFDYDGVKSVNPVNVRKIMKLNVSLFAKCGLIVKYCCIAGDDVSAWAGLSTKEKSERLTDATRLVSYLLGNEYQPVVEVIPKDKWENKTAGGMCCDGGKRIIYREDCCADYDWTIDAVCHECYHAFQHTLQYHGWQEWHWRELGVTEYRVPEWEYNFSNYKDSKSGVNYMVQVVESDARAFAKDCIMQSNGQWHLVDWE